MSALTDRLYVAWKRQNGAVRGMGAMAPMKARQWPFQLSDSAGNAVMRPRISSRPEKQKETPASVTSTPEVVTTVKGTNNDGTNCRP